MGLILEINLDKDIKEIDAFFDNLKFKAVTTAARQGLNRAATRVRTVAMKEIRQRRNLKLKDTKKRISIKKAKGSNLAQLEARINFSGIPLPLILFIVGKPKPVTQKRANPDRKPRSFTVIKGQTKKRRGLFVEKASRGKLRFRVFRRSDPSKISAGFKVQAVASIAQLLRTNGNMIRRIENQALTLLQIEYNRALKFQLLNLKF